MDPRSFYQDYTLCKASTHIKLGIRWSSLNVEGRGGGDGRLMGCVEEGASCRG